MRLGFRRGAAMLAVTGMIAAACSSAASPSPSTAPAASAAASTAPAASAEASAATTGWPYTGTLADGSTFTLAPRIAEKIKNHEKINYVMSYQGPGVPLFSEQYQAGFNNSLPEAQAIYPMDGVQIGPVSASGIDPAGQIAQIEALLNTDKIDCIAIEPIETDSFTPIDNKLLAKGIPVFTVGITSNDNALTNFTQIPMKEGAQAADIVLQWMKDNNVDIKNFAVSGGDPGSTWGHGRMQSFYDTIMAAIPDANFISAPDNALTVPYDQKQAYDTAKAYLTGHPEIQFILNANIGAEQIGRAIHDAGLDGKVHTIGWNTSYGQLDMIDSGTQVAALDQKWSEQAGFGALACAEFFANGKVLPNTQELAPVTKANSAEARAELDKILKK